MAANLVFKWNETDLTPTPRVCVTSVLSRTANTEKAPQPPGRAGADPCPTPSRRLSPGRSRVLGRRRGRPARARYRALGTAVTSVLNWRATAERRGARGDPAVAGFRPSPTCSPSPRRARETRQAPFARVRVFDVRRRSAARAERRPTHSQVVSEKGCNRRKPAQYGFTVV